MTHNKPSFCDFKGLETVRLKRNRCISTRCDLIFEEYRNQFESNGRN